MWYVLILCGCAFLFVPSFSIFDFMPDAIGYALILIGLSKISAVNGDLHNSRRSFGYLFFLTLVRLLLMVPLTGLNDETTSLLYVFCFAVAETVFLIPAFSSLCEGSYYLSSRAGANVSDKAHDDFRLMTKIFIIGRAVLAVAPELTVLANKAYRESISAEELDMPTVYDGKGIFTVICFIVSLLIGVVFMILALRYFVPLARDKASNEQIKRRYDDEIGNNEEKRVYNAVKSASLLFTLGCAFMAAMYFYGWDILPDVVGAGLMLAGFAALNPVINTKKAMIVSGVAVAVTAAATALEYHTAKTYFTDASYITAASMNSYLISASVKALGFFSFAVLIYYVYRCLCIIVKKHTKSPTFDEAGYKKRLYNRCKALCVAGIAACGISAACGFLFSVSELFRFAALILFAAYAIYLYVTANKLCEELSRYI